MLDYTGLRNGLVVTAFWKAKPDETEAVAAILQRFMPQAQQEPGVRAFMIHQSKSEPSEFFFYEVFENEDAFAAHQQTPHFKALIAGEALPKLVKRERAQYASHNNESTDNARDFDFFEPCDERIQGVRNDDAEQQRHHKRLRQPEGQNRRKRRQDSER